MQEGTVCTGGQNPTNTSDVRPPVPGVSGKRIEYRECSRLGHRFEAVDTTRTQKRVERIEGKRDTSGSGDYDTSKTDERSSGDIDVVDRSEYLMFCTRCGEVREVKVPQEA